MPVLRKLAGCAAVAALLAASTGLAAAVEPPSVAPGPAPPDPPPAPDQPMHQVAGCTRTAVIPGSDFREMPPALDLMNMPAAWNESTGAGVVIAVIDTGVAPSPRLPHLVAGGDYVMGPYGDGLADCDAHGTVIASLIGAAPSGAPLPARPRGAVPAPPPAAAPAPKPIPPPPPPPTVTVTSTATPAPVTVQAPPPPPPPDDAPNWITSSVARGGPGGPVPRQPPPGGGPDGLIGIAPDAVIVSIRQSSHTFGPVNPGIEADPEAAQRAGDINSLARAIVHAANLGVKVINISVVACLPAAAPADQAALGAAVRYAAVDRDVVIVTAAGNAGESGCKQNPDPVPTDRADPLGWNSVTTVATPAWFSDYVLSVSATDSLGVPLSGQAASLHGPWVGLAAPGADIVGLSTDGQLINSSIDTTGGAGDTLKPIAGSSFSSAFVAGVAALVRAKFPQLSAHQVIHRLEATAHPPAGGRDTVVGYGVVDPVGALTWDVPPGDQLPSGATVAPLYVPPPPAAPDPWPKRVAVAGTAAAVALVGALVWVVTVTRRRRQG